MVVNKTTVFFKRTLHFLLPLPVFTFGLKILSAGEFSSSFVTIFGKYDKKPTNSALKLASKLNNSLPPGFEDRGSIIKFKSDSLQDQTIEQLSPFNLDSLGSGYEYLYKEASIKTSSSSSGSSEFYFTSQSSGEDKKKYAITEDVFKKYLEDKGDLQLVTQLKITINGEKTLFLATTFPLDELIYSSGANSIHPIFLLKSNAESDSGKQYSLKFSKNMSSKSLEIEVENSSSSSDPSGFQKIEIEKFYFLYTLEPPLDFSGVFSGSDSTEIPDQKTYSNKRLIHLEKWDKSTSQSNAKFSFDSQKSDFWKSICRDPYKVGGWIDADLTTTSNGDVVPSKAPATASTQIKKQKENWQEFRSGFDFKPKQTKQYFWEEDGFKNPGSFVPSSDYTTPSPCENMDNDTKTLYKEYFGKGLDSEPSSVKITYLPDVQYFKDAKDDKSSSGSNSNSYPIQKIVQSSFRAWGNGITSKTNPMDEKIYSSTFENALQTDHTFSMKIEKSMVESRLIDHTKLNNLKNSSDVSSVLQMNFHLSYSVYDPLSNYYKKHNLILPASFDVRYIYQQDYFNKLIFSKDLSTSHGIMGYDFKGSTDDSKKDNPFGVSGFLEFISSLEVDLEGNFLIKLTARTKGFVNTKNTDCDLRHRTFKFQSNQSNQSKCFSTWDSEKKYRKHNHIPSFLIISLEKDPVVNSFYLRGSGRDDNSNTDCSSDSSEIINTLCTLKTLKLNKKDRTLKRKIYFDDSDDGELYFDTYKDSQTSDVQKTTIGYTGPIVYYHKPIKSTNVINLKDLTTDLSSITLYIGGASYLSSLFFRSHHYNTWMTLCMRNDFNNGNNNGQLVECANGEKYGEQHKDKTSSELIDKEGTQKVEIPWSKLSSQSQSFQFRAIINAKYDDANKFDGLKEKYEKLFKDDAEDMNESNKSNYPSNSFAAAWYSLDLSWDNSKYELTYITKLRTISMTSKPIKNENTQHAIGARADFGFKLDYMELNYKKSSSGSA